MSSDTIDTLRRMANDIARNLAAMGHDKAVLATADHIDKFWDPRMKKAIFADDGTGLLADRARGDRAPRRRRAPRIRRPARPSSTPRTRSAIPTRGEPVLPSRLREGSGAASQTLATAPRLTPARNGRGI